MAKGKNVVQRNSVFGRIYYILGGCYEHRK